MTLEEFTNKIGGTVKIHSGKKGVWFDGPKEVPQNALFIPLGDLGYNPKNGVFRKSIKPKLRSILKI